MTCPPVVLLTFNRADMAEQVLDQIRQARPEHLFLGSDGPRENFPGDVDKIAEVRAMLDRAVDWPCTVRRLYWDSNRACEGNTELTVDAAFAEVDRAIIFDDDCVPDPSFFRFCGELLERYADDPRVAHIAGNTDGAPLELFGGDSYAFTAFASNCGWATWSRAWHAHRASFPRPHDHTTVRVAYGKPTRYMAQADSRVFRPGRSGLISPASRRFFADVGIARDLSLSEWGQQWRLSTLNAGQLAIVPSVNLIKNVGFTAESTSGLPERDTIDSGTLSFPLRHPERVEINPAVERYTERILIRAVGRLARSVRKATPRPLREAARRVGALVVR